MAYFSNASHGDSLLEQCNRCPIGNTTCPIEAVQLLFNHEQGGNKKLQAAMNLLINEKCECQMLPLLEPPEQTDAEFLADVLGEEGGA